MAKKQIIGTIDDGKAYILQAGTPIYVKTADICAMTGKSNQWIGQLTSQGILNKTQTPHGALYDVTASIKAYIKSMEDKAEQKSKDSQETEKLEKQRMKADTSIKASKAIVAKLNAEELQGKMHRSEDVAAMTEDLIYTLRAGLMSLGGRLAHDLAAISDPAEISAAIDKEAYKLMDELSMYKYDSKKYEERVRSRLNKDPIDMSSEDDG